MYKKKTKSTTKNKFFIALSILIIVVSLAVSLSFRRNTTTIENIFKDISMFINELFMKPFTTLAKDSISNQDESYIIQKNINESLEKEISELKEALELNRTLTEYSVENATILSRNKSYWFNTITIDKGKKDDLKKDMAVITSNGLIGKISKVYSNSSEIKLITSDDVNYKVSVSIKVNETDNYAILNGYDQSKNLLKVTGVSKTTSVNKGDIVVTSGLGELFPAGIFIGTVEEIANDKYDLSKTLYIKTKQDFNNIHYVTVLKEKK